MQAANGQRFQCEHPRRHPRGEPLCAATQQRREGVPHGQGLRHGSPNKVGIILTKLEKLVNKTTDIGLTYESVRRGRLKQPKHVKVTGKEQIAKFEKFVVSAVTEMRTDPDSWSVKWFDTPRKLKRANERSYGKLERNPRSPQSSARSGSASASK